MNLEVVSREGELLARTTTQVAAPLTGQRRLSRARIAMLANLAPLSGQPVLADLAPFTAGTVEVNLELVDDGDATLMARGGLRGAITAELGRLPDVELRVDAEGRPGERIALALPVVIESAEFGRSNLELNGAGTKDARGAYDFDASLTGTQIVVADIERLVQMLSPRQVAPAAPQPARGELVSAEQRSAIAKLRTHRHSVPIWSDYVRGTARVDIERVLLGSFAVDDVRGRLDMSPERAALSGVQASMLGAALESSATIDFDAALPKPYTLALAASVADLAVERLFLTAAPDETPTAEGRFDLEIALNGVGLNPLDLGLSSLGAIRLSGRDGVFRGLAASAGTGSTCCASGRRADVLARATRRRPLARRSRRASFSRSRSGARWHRRWQHDLEHSARGRAAAAHRRIGNARGRATAAARAGAARSFRAARRTRRHRCCVRRHEAARGRSRGRLSRADASDLDRRLACGARHRGVLGVAE